MRDKPFKKPSDFIAPHAKEAVKMYITYDGNSRMEFTYVAIYDAEDGEACMKTQYVYDSTSNRVVKMQETLAAWDSAWDVP